jgi:hypothetical protein
VTHGVVPLTHAAATDSCACQRRGIVHDFERHSSGLGVFGRLCVCVSLSLSVCLCLCVSVWSPGVHLELIGYLLLPPGESQIP